MGGFGGKKARDDCVIVVRRRIIPLARSRVYCQSLRVAYVSRSCTAWRIKQASFEMGAAFLEQCGVIGNETLLSVI